jgi:Spy/CpxP family protein refolding chaperone
MESLSIHALEVVMKIALISKLLATAAVVTIAVNSNLAQAQQPSVPPFLQGIELTSEQQSEIAQISESYRQEIDSLLSPEQQSQFRSAIASGGNPREAMRAANLSSEQKQKMKEIMRSQREEISNLLTPEQKQKLRDNRHSPAPM